MACLGLTLKQYNNMYYFTEATLIFIAETQVEQILFLHKISDFTTCW